MNPNPKNEIMRVKEHEIRPKDNDNKNCDSQNLKHYKNKVMIDRASTV